MDPIRAAEREKDVALMHRVARGEPAAQRELVRRLFVGARAVCASLVKSGAADATIGALVTVLRSAKSYSGEGSIEAWAYPVVARSARSTWKESDGLAGAPANGERCPLPSEEDDEAIDRILSKATGSPSRPEIHAPASLRRALEQGPRSRFITGPRSMRTGAFGPASIRARKRRFRPATVVAAIALLVIAGLGIFLRNEIFERTGAPMPDAVVLSGSSVLIDDKEAPPGTKLPIGALILAAGGPACFHFEPRTSVCLEGGGRARIAANDTAHRTIELIEGRIGLVVDARDDDGELAVNTRSGKAVAIGSAAFVAEVDDEAGTSARVDVVDGAVSLRAPMHLRVRVEAHHSASTLGSARALGGDEEARDRAFLARTSGEVH